MELVINAVALGLSTGVYCAGFCLPVMLPITLVNDTSSARRRMLAIATFSAGRLVAYLLIGGLASYLGRTFQADILRPMTAVSFILLSLLLIGYGLISGFPHFKLCSYMKKALPESRFAILTGFMVGLHLCPPFLLAVSYVFEIGQIATGVLFFLIFFFTTSIYLLPFILFGYFARMEAMRWIAKFSTILAGFLFLWLGVSQFVVMAI